MQSTNGAIGRPNRSQGKLSAWLEARFQLRDRGTDFWTEVRAGTSTFLTMAYILLVNPHIMGDPNTGIPRTDVVVGTAVASALGSFFVGFLANLPFGIAPGLGLSAYLSYGLVKGNGLPWEGALTSAFLAGLIVFILGVTNLADLAMRWIPITIKVATVIGMGLLLTFIGMQSIDLVVAAGDDSLVKLGPLDRVELWISLAGLMLLATLAHHRVQGGVVIGIFVVTGVVWAMDGTYPESWFQFPRESAPIWEAATQFRLVLNSVQKYAPGIGAFLLVGVFDVSGVMFGLAVLAGLDQEDSRGHVHVPRSKWVFMAAGLSTMVAACLGCSPTIVHIESAAGIKEGGKSGLTAVVIGMWFLVSLFFAPLFGSIPQEATAPVVILIGASMIGQASEIDWKQMRVAVPAFLTLSLMPFSFSIPNGIFFGLLSNLILYVTCGDICGKNNEDYDALDQHEAGGRPITEAGKSISYGTVSSANLAGGSSFPRTYSTDSFVRSPNLILRKGEYASNFT
mmetsp:Transcript_14561/g.26122  ORF Transcript_14561/g.26122 Transcript_14561/m.26122 type:complete len:510 (-) Transcript_14561:32-1561(-)